MPLSLTTIAVLSGADPGAAMKVMSPDVQSGLMEGTPLRAKIIAKQIPHLAPLLSMTQSTHFFLDHNPSYPTQNEKRVATWNPKNGGLSLGDHAAPNCEMWVTKTDVRPDFEGMTLPNLTFPEGGYVTQNCQVVQPPKNEYTVEVQGGKGALMFGQQENRLLIEFGSQAHCEQALPNQDNENPWSELRIPLDHIKDKQRPMPKLVMEVMQKLMSLNPDQTWEYQKCIICGNDPKSSLAALDFMNQVTNLAKLASEKIEIYAALGLTFAEGKFRKAEQQSAIEKINGIFSDPDSPVRALYVFDQTKKKSNSLQSLKFADQYDREEYQPADLHIFSKNLGNEQQPRQSELSDQNSDSIKSQHVNFDTVLEKLVCDHFCPRDKIEEMFGSFGRDKPFMSELRSSITSLRHGSVNRPRFGSIVSDIAIQEENKQEEVKDSEVVEKIKEESESEDDTQEELKEGSGLNKINESDVRLGKLNLNPKK